MHEWLPSSCFSDPQLLVIIYGWVLSDLTMVQNLCIPPSLSLPLSLSSPLPSPLFYPFVFTHAHTKTSWWITILKIITRLHVVFQVVLNLQKRYKYRYLLLVHTLVLCHLLIVMYSCIERKFLLRGCWLPLNRSFVTQHLWSLPICILLA